MIMDSFMKILLIEDDTVDSMFFKRSLKTTGFNVELLVAEDAISGIKLFNSENFTEGLY